MRRAGLAAAAAIMAMGALTACGGSDEDFCNLDTEFSDVDPQEDADAFKDALDEAVDNAPDDIKGDVETMRDAFDDYDPDDPSSAADMDMDTLGKASKNVQDWTDENCD